MTHKQRMQQVLAGHPTDRIPWCPRLDLWYKANRRAGTLPSRFCNATLLELVDELNFAHHAIVPDFKNLRSPADEIHRALGVYNLECMPYQTQFENVDVRYEQRGDELAVEYVTPHGTLRTRTLHNEAMRCAGITISHITEHAFKDAGDYKAIAYLFEHAVVVPNEAGYRRYADWVGERGFAAGFVSLAGSPMHLVLRELMEFETLWYETADHPEELAICVEAIGRYFDKVLRVSAESSAEVFLLGANYDVTLTNPDFFRQHIQPWLRKFSDLLHPRGKFLLTHTDGENSGLLDCYLESGVDIADSVCPKPMTQLSIKDVRAHFNGRISIMGGVPSVSLVKEAMPDAEFQGFLDSFFAELGSGDHLILGISDTTPPSAEFDRLLEIARRIEQFGPVRPMKKA